MLFRSGIHASANELIPSSHTGEFVPPLPNAHAAGDGKGNSVASVWFVVDVRVFNPYRAALWRIVSLDLLVWYFGL